jgi:hypothetical protein
MIASTVSTASRALVRRDHDALVTLTRRRRRRSCSQGRLTESMPIDQSSRLWVNDAKVHRQLKRTEASVPSSSSYIEVAAHRYAPSAALAGA